MIENPNKILLENQNEIPSNVRTSNRTKNRPQTYYNINGLCDYEFVHALLTDFNVPNTFDKIKYMDDKACWEQAIKDEIDSLMANNT